MKPRATRQLTSLDRSKLTKQERKSSRETNLLLLLYNIEKAAPAHVVRDETAASVPPVVDCCRYTPFAAETVTEQLLVVGVRPLS